MSKKEQKQNEVKVESNEEKAEEKAATPAPVPQEQVEALAKEVLHWKDLALRTAAEMENLRKRCQIDMQNTAKYANKDFAKDMLPVVDNLENALKHTRVEMGKATESLPPFLTSLYQGVEMTHKQLLNALEKHKITKMQDVGQVFNPDKHQVIQQVEDPSKPAGTIIEEMQTGYELDGRVLREAMVIVTKEPPVQG